MPTIVFLVSLSLPLFGAAAYLHMQVKRYQKHINPLTKSMRRPPGTQLGRELGKEQLEVGYSIAGLPFLAFVAYFVFSQSYYSMDGIRQWIYIAIALLVWIIGSLYLIVSLSRRWVKISRLRLGYECELAVGQELNLLMLYGYHIFHDVPADGFNIDHIVVGPNGVIAVETKGRSKSINSSSSNKQYRVTYENEVLTFPTWEDTVTVPQAKRQAQWAATWLSSATGISVKVEPVVVIPGWFIESSSRQTVPVIASGYIQKFFQSAKGAVLSPEQVSQIIYQIDQKVRDLPPGEVVRPLLT